MHVKYSEMIHVHLCLPIVAGPEATHLFLRAPICGMPLAIVIELHSFAPTTAMSSF